ncbi:MAG: ferrous iron transport protein B [Coriobacteriales bacterium]|jgi:ferrous iron transporter FeoB|nr:ferrous iron transport protein B [Coriobacteriales bacterium]
MKIALIGNPNAGKTTLFNELTGANQHVGNWPGVTVERKEGKIRSQYGSGDIVDLPGIYSLSPFSMEEVVARDYIVQEQPDVVVDIVDATNLERQLYLAVQLMEMDVPLVIALNMMDELERKGETIDTTKLSHDFGVPVIPISAARKQGLDVLISALPHATRPKRHDLPNASLERLIARTESIIHEHLDAEHQLDIRHSEHHGRWLPGRHGAFGGPGGIGGPGGRGAAANIAAAANARSEALKIHDAMVNRHVQHSHDAMHAHAGHAGQGAWPGARRADNLDRGMHAPVPNLDEHYIEYTKAGFPIHWSAIKVLESDDLVLKQLTLDDDTLKEINALKDAFEREHMLLCTAFADARYKYIHDLLKDVIAPFKPSRTDRVDKILTSRWAGIPIFLVIMFLMFHLTFSESLFGSPLPSPGVALQDLMQMFLNWASSSISVLFVDGSWAQSLVVDGIFGGVGTVLSFVPQIVLMFLFLTLLEDCGYMARAAFVMNRLFKRFGLSGKSAMPMLMGFGCNVPAAMACRTLDSDQDRKTTLMLVPFMSCSARTPIFLVFAGAFFPSYADFVLFAMYIIGIVLALITGVIVKKFIFKGASNPFIIELPRYRAPRGRSVGLTLWDKLKDFLQRAATIIFVMSIVVWFLSNFGWTNGTFGMVDMGVSMMAGIGNFIAPLFTPVGFPFWTAAVAILAGFIAKESVVGTLGVLFGAGGSTNDTGSGLSAAVLSAAGFTPLASVAFMVFCLLYVPCVATVATLAREFNSWKWTVGQICYSVVVAYIMAFIVYQGGMLLGLA